MIRLTWRQFRTQAVVVAGLLAAIAIALAITGPHLVHLYHISVVPCQTRGDCSLAISAFLGHDGLLQDLGTVLVVVPGIIGVFWGAPLVGPRTRDRHLQARPGRKASPAGAGWRSSSAWSGCRASPSPGCSA